MPVRVCVGVWTRIEGASQPHLTQPQPQAQLHPNATCLNVVHVQSLHLRKLLGHRGVCVGVRACVCVGVCVRVWVCVIEPCVGSLTLLP